MLRVSVARLQKVKGPGDKKLDVPMGGEEDVRNIDGALYFSPAHQRRQRRGEPLTACSQAEIEKSYAPSHLKILSHKLAGRNSTALTRHDFVHRVLQ